MAAISSAVDFPLHSDIEHKIHDVDAKVTTVEDDVPEWTEADQIIMKKALRKLDWTLVPAFGVGLASLGWTAAHDSGHLHDVCAGPLEHW